MSVTESRARVTAACPSSPRPFFQFFLPGPSSVKVISPPLFWEDSLVARRAPARLHLPIYLEPFHITLPPFSSFPSRIFFSLRRGGTAASPRRWGNLRGGRGSPAAPLYILL